MRKTQELENRIKMLECGVNRGHSYRDGVFIKRDFQALATITLKCILCGYELTKFISELSVEEKAAAVRLDLIVEEPKDG